MKMGGRLYHIFMDAFVCISLAAQAQAFSQGESRPTKISGRPIEKVAVIGGGIAGLSLAHALSNSINNEEECKPIEVSIFDSRQDFDRSAGAGVQLNGGMSVLGKINPSVQEAVINAAVPIRRLQARSKSWFRDTTDQLWDLSLENLIRNAGGRTEEELIVGSRIMWYSIMRGALQEKLIETLPKDAVEVRFNKKLIGIKGQDDGAVCEFADGTTAGPFGLIVGTDGIKSAVKEYVCTGNISFDDSKREGSATALYSGIRIGFAVQDVGYGDEDNDPEPIQQIFGDGSYMFMGPYGNGEGRPLSRCVFITSLDDNYNGPFKRKGSEEARAAAENSDWSQDVVKPLETRRKMMKLYQQSNVKDEAISSVIKKSDRIFELGVYFHNPISLAGWKKKIPGCENTFAVLCGDSAHAMPPFLGQGANQAIQSAFSLADKVHRYNRELQKGAEIEDQSMQKLLREYEKSRWIPTTSITAKATILGYLETGGRAGFYAKFRDAFFSSLTAVGVTAKVLLDAATPKV